MHHKARSFESRYLKWANLHNVSKIKHPWSLTEWNLGGGVCGSFNATDGCCTAAVVMWSSFLIFHDSFPATLKISNSLPPPSSSHLLACWEGKRDFGYATSLHTFPNPCGTSFIPCTTSHAPSLSTPHPEPSLPWHFPVSFPMSATLLTYPYDSTHLS